MTSRSTPPLAFRDILSPPFRGVLLKSLALTIALLVALWLALEWLLAQLGRHAMAVARHGVLDILTGIGLVIGLGFLVAPVAALFAGLFLDDIAEAVERTHYPADPPGRPLPLARSLATSLKFLGVVLLVNALALPLVLFVGFGVLIFLVANAYLLGREYFELAALRHHDEATVRRLRARHSGTIFARRAAHRRLPRDSDRQPPRAALRHRLHGASREADRDSERRALGLSLAGLWTAIPIPTSAMPTSSTGEGICRSTTAPTIAAVAGSSASISAKVARGSRAMASWSQT